MTQASQGTVIWSIVIATVILGALILFSASQIPEVPEINIPTAEAIAAAIVIPEVVIPEAQRIDTNAINHLLEAEFTIEVNELEDDCIVGLESEFDKDDVNDEVKALIEADLGEEINIDTINYNYENDYDFNIVNLGLDDEEDREAEIASTLRVTYQLEDGNSDEFRETVYAEASCSNWDEDDKEFDDLTVKYTL